MGVECIGDYAEKVIRIKAKQLIGRAGFTEADYEDLAQDLRQDLWRRLPRFDPARAPYEAFVTQVVAHCIATILEARKAALRDYRRTPCSLNDPLDSASGDHPAERGDTFSEDAGRLRTGGAQRPAEEHVDLRHDVQAVLAGLPPELHCLCRQLMKRTPTEVEHETGTSRGTVYESIQKIRRRFEQAKLKAYL